MKTVVYLHLDTGNSPNNSSGSSTTEEDDHEKEAACPVCALSQPPTHWHCLLPSRETFKVEAVPLLTEALATSCSVCTRAPAGSALKMCSHCRAVVYCSEECQLQDWRQGQHASRCQRQVSAGRKLIKSVAELGVDLPGLQTGSAASAKSAGHAANAGEGFNGGSGQQQQPSYRGHQQQFFNRLQQQQTSSRNGGSAFATYKYKTQMSTNGHTAGAIPKTPAPVMTATAPSTLTTPATPAAATTLPCANTAPPPPPPLPTKANKSAVEAKYQLKPIPINEAMQHHELKDVTDGPWRKGGIKEVPKEVPQFPKEFLNEKEKEEVVAKQEHYQEQQQQKLPNSCQVNTVNTDQQKRKFLVPLIFGPTPPQSTTPESTAVSAVQKGKSASSPAPASLEIPCTSDPTPVSSLEAEKYFDGVVSKLPRYQLTSGKAYHLMPLHLEESVDRKRVHFHVAYRDFIGKLMVEIGKVVAQGVPVEPASIEPGDILLVKYDGEWFRAQVLRLTSTAFYVEYFDFGNRKYVDRREVAAGDFFRTLPAAISVQRLPPTAIRVQVRNVPSFQQFNLLQRLINEAIHKLSLLKLYVVEYCPEADCYTVQFDEI